MNSSNGHIIKNKSPSPKKIATSLYGMNVNILDDDDDDRDDGNDIEKRVNSDQGIEGNRTGLRITFWKYSSIHFSCRYLAQQVVQQPVLAIQERIKARLFKCFLSDIVPGIMLKL